MAAMALASQWRAGATENARFIRTAGKWRQSITFPLFTISNSLIAAMALGVAAIGRDGSDRRGVEPLEAALRRGALFTCRIRARSPSIVPIRSRPCCR
jgi:hypothetical protein